MILAARSPVKTYEGDYVFSGFFWSGICHRVKKMNKLTLNQKSDKKTKVEKGVPPPQDSR